MDDSREASATERARVLQEHLVRTAYALHFCAAEAAATHDRRAEQHDIRPSRVDHRLQGKRWQAVSDQAMDIVRRWDNNNKHETERDNVFALHVATPQDVPVGERSELGPKAVERLFAAASELQVLITLSHPALRERAHSALESIDAAIRHIRALADE